MLVKVSIENFKSFDSKTEFTMISSNKIRSHRDHKIEIKGTALLKYAVIYGANASGKTNLCSSIFNTTFPSSVVFVAVAAPSTVSAHILHFIP